jgi:hypothetical protein
MAEIPNKSAEQKVAEGEVESFRKDLGPFVVAAETTRMAMVFTDANELTHPARARRRSDRIGISQCKKVGSPTAGPGHTRSCR